MGQSLSQRVAQVQTTARRLVWYYALARVTTVTVIVAVSICLVDYLLRPHDLVFRWLLSAVVIGAATSAATKFAMPALRLRQSLVGVASRIELRFPQLGGRLSSALAFQSQPEEDSTAGSPDLRRAVIAEAEALAADLDFRITLDSR